MTDTPNLGLPFIEAAQAQKHVTHNEALRRLDAIVQLSVTTRALAAPPASPANGARYLVAAAATGAWAGQSGKIAAFQDGAWAFLSPSEGWLIWIADEAALLVWHGAAWIAAGAQSVAMLGINATADTSNRLALSSPSSLFNHAGGGHQLKLNKASAADTASLLFQDGFSGRAEIGLAGDDNLHVKVSADGAAWRDALLIDRASGAVSFPSGGPGNANLLINGDFQINQRSFAGAGLAAGSYGYDRWKADTGGANLTLSGAALTLSAGGIVQLIEPAQCGLASLASMQLTFSLQGLTGGAVTISIGSVGATLNAGTGAQAVTLTTAAGDTGNLTVKIARASGTPEWQRVKLELGAVATPWLARPHEDWLCARYATRAVLSLQAPAAGSLACPFTFAREMRATPTAVNLTPGTATNASLSVEAATSALGGTFQIAASAAGGAILNRVTLYSAEL